MYIKINKTKIPIEIKTTLMDRIKSFRFKLDEINYGLCFPKKRKINTYFYCQKVDIIMTDKDNKILNIFLGVNPEEKVKGNKKVYFTYVFPQNVLNQYEIDDKFDVILNKNDKEILNNIKN